MKLNETALVVIDIINMCCHERCEVKEWDLCFKKIRKMVPRLERFIKKYKSMGGRVIYINCVPWKKGFLPENIVELYKDPKAIYYSKDNTGFAEKFFVVKPEKEDELFTKNTYDAFSNPKLSQFLKKKRIKSLIITGINGDACVHSTIDGAFSRGYHLIILKDLIETSNLKIRQKLQKLLKEYTWPTTFGKTINSKDLFKFIKND